MTRLLHPIFWMLVIDILGIKRLAHAFDITMDTLKPFEIQLDQLANGLTSWVLQLNMLQRN